MIYLLFKSAADFPVFLHTGSSVLKPRFAVGVLPMHGAPTAGTQLTDARVQLQLLHDWSPPPGPL